MRAGVTVKIFALRRAMATGQLQALSARYARLQEHSAVDSSVVWRHVQCLEARRSCDAAMAAESAAESARAYEEALDHLRLQRACLEDAAAAPALDDAANLVAAASSARASLFRACTSDLQATRTAVANQANEFRSATSELEDRMREAMADARRIDDEIPAERELAESLTALDRALTQAVAWHEPAEAPPASPPTDHVARGERSTMGTGGTAATAWTWRVPAAQRRY